MPDRVLTPKEALRERFWRELPPNLRDAVRALTEELAKAGGRIRLVGGSVRDLALADTVTDLDFEVFGLAPDRLEAVLRTHFRVDCVGRSFGIFKLKGLPVDVAIPRRESKTGPAHRDFAVEGDPEMSEADAAMRRDFTINAISLDPVSGVCFDPYGGWEDLLRGRLFHVSEKFAEDPLRVLRGMQFVARFELTPDPATIALCQSLTQDGLAIERVFGEWRKWLLQGRDLAAGLEFLKATGWLCHYPELAALDGCPQDPKWHPEGDVWAHTGHCLNAYARTRLGDEHEDTVVGLAVLCHDLGKPATTFTDADGRIRSPRHDSVGVDVARTFLERITRQRSLIDEVLPLVREHMRPHDLYANNASANAVRRLAQRVGRIDRLVRVAEADYAGRPPTPAADFRAGQWLAEAADQLSVGDTRPVPLLQGRDLLGLGMKPGPAMGSILADVFEAQLDGRVSTNEEALEWARKKLARQT